MQRNIVLAGNKRTLVAPVCCDQVLFTPAHLFVFLSSMSVLEGSDPREKLRTSFLSAYKANLMLWPWVQGVNFTFVPLEHRVLVVNVVSLGEYSVIYVWNKYGDGDAKLVHLGWNCILSLINNKRS